ncbi:MAG: DEAD/DEAH box helicase family protein [Oscillospiraceae bacterium]|nr:DEAD/DEAH box helicase family protein [Oscillospiraceae bacterium]
MAIFNNVTNKVRDDLIKTIREGSQVSVAAACFSMYAYHELKAQLEEVDEFRFIFTSPTFVTEKQSKQKREFYIPRLTRERNIYGTEFEIKLRNEMTQKAVAKECADWIRRKARFKSNATGDTMPYGFMTIYHQKQQYVYQPFSGFTTVDIGCERGNNSYNMITRLDGFENTVEFLKLFEAMWRDRSLLEDVTDVVIDNISAAYNENSPELIYFITLFNVFNEFLEDISEDVLPNEATGFKQSKIWSMLYDFQRDAVLAIINKLEKYNGCILADSVGLGKTFTALAVIKYYENRNKSVLVLCPKKLAQNWNTYKDNYVNNPIASDRLNYDVLFHTDLSRTRGTSNGLDLDRLNWGNYDLVVIDEYEIIGLNLKSQLNQGFRGLVLFLLTLKIADKAIHRRQYAQNRNLSAERGAASLCSASTRHTLPTYISFRRPTELSACLDLHRLPLRHSTHVPVARAA